MNYDNIKDYRLQKALKKSIAQSGKSFALRTLEQCCSRSANPVNGVAILSNSSHTRIYGARMCKNSWACPICSAVQASKIAARLAAGLDALKETHNAIMITFTIFHSKNDSCKQAFDLLFETWVAFTANRHRYSGYGKFLSDLNIVHHARCSEVTYSENGWHPHFHCLFWVPKENFNKVLAYENMLVEAWRTSQERVMKRIYGYTKYNAFYESERLHPSQRGVFISKSEGNPIIMKSSDYLCGWGADSEATGNYRKEATCKTSRSMYQLLTDGANGDKTAMDLYLEFAEYVIKHKRRRWDLGRSGLKAIIGNYINSEGYREVMKKKRIQYLDEKGAWHLVAWFSSEQWSKICWTDNTLNFSLVTLILCMSKYPNAHELICEILQLHRIPPCLNYDPIGYVDNFIDILNGCPREPNDKGPSWKELTALLAS